MENNTLCNRHSLGVNNHTKMYVTYTRIYGWSDYGGESSYQPGYRLENMMWMTLLVYDYIIPGEKFMPSDVLYILIYVVLAVVLAFFLKISPARNANLNKKKMLVDLKAGDQIIMECGIYGTVKEIKDDQVKICVNDNAANTEMLIEKSAIKTIMVQE